MIYCVVPVELADELYDKLRDYYADDPHVEVIVDRRRRGRSGSPPARLPEPRRRRRARAIGDFPKIEVPS